MSTNTWAEEVLPSPQFSSLRKAVRQGGGGGGGGGAWSCCLHPPLGAGGAAADRAAPQSRANIGSVHGPLDTEPA